MCSKFIVDTSHSYWIILRFVKNLSPDQIHLSTLKGEGELKNLVLNEDLLTELLELPTWLRLRGATCDRVSVRIAWTKLKSVPMHLALEEVNNAHNTGMPLMSSASQCWPDIGGEEAWKVTRVPIHSGSG